MSDETAQEPVEQDAEEAGEPSRIGGAIVALVLVGLAVLVMKAIITAAPYVAYFVAGLLVCHAWHRISAWRAKRRGAEPGDDDADVGEEREPLPETLHRLANPHVFIADLADAAGISKEAARAVLESHGIRVRRAVRNGESTGVGVHKDDIPPLPRPLSETPVDAVDQEQPTNQQGVTVEKMGLTGYIVRDPADAVRRHRVE